MAKKKNSPTPIESQPKTAPSRYVSARRRFVRVIIIGIALLCALSLGWKIQAFGQGLVDPNVQTSASRTALLDRLHIVQSETAKLSPQFSTDAQAELNNKMQQIKLALAAGEYDTAGILLTDYASLLNVMQERLLASTLKPNVPEQPQGPPVTGKGEFLPILIYHKTPADFAAQLDWLIAHGYTTVSMSQLSAHLRFRAALPQKPIVITFDDGFTDQLNAFNALQARKMHATFYVIVGGAASQYCIGIERHAGLNCGDSYLNWDQVTMLDHSGLIEIGAHTLDHLNLPAQSAAVQHAQIFDSKAILEQHLGHTVTTFAYPYGSYNSSTVSDVRAAGFTSAVTTTAGTEQNFSQLYTLKRIREVYSLP